MITAVISSTIFLVGYVIYHVHVGEKSTHFAAQGMVRPLYFAMLISHVLLAFTTLPLVILTLIPGVLVYLMLYKWFPPPNLAPGP